MISLEVESSFESVICPVLAKENRLFAVNIPSDTWIPVNTLKGLESIAIAIKK